MHWKFFFSGIQPLWGNADLFRAWLLFFAVCWCRNWVCLVLVELTVDPHFQPSWVLGHLKHHPSISVVIGDRSCDLVDLVSMPMIYRSTHRWSDLYFKYIQLDVNWLWFYRKTLILWQSVVHTANKSPHMSHELPQQRHLAKLGASYSQQIMPSVMYINSANDHPRVSALMYIYTNDVYSNICLCKYLSTLPMM